MNKSALAIVSLLLLSSYAQAMEENRNTVYLGASVIAGDLSNLSDKTAFTVGYDYTLPNRMLIGGYFTPKLLSESGSVSSFVSSIDSSAVGIYGGYHFENNFRATAGVTFTKTELMTSIVNLPLTSDEETNVGFNVGADYILNNIMLGGRISYHDIIGIKGTTVGFNLGFQF